MISNRLAAYLAMRRVHYGWAVLGATFLVMLATAGAMGASGVIIAPLEAEFGWSNADISSALAVRLALYGLIGPFAAALINRFGARAVVAVAMTLIAIGVAGTASMRHLWQLELFWGVIVGLGSGMTALVLGATVATRWFSARRGLAVGLLTASNATGQLVFLPLLAAVSGHWGWRAALALVVAILVVALAFALALLRDRPADVGLPPLRRARHRPGAEGRCRLRLARLRAARRFARGREEPGLLGAVRHLLRLRPQHQRPDPDPLDHAVRRLWRRAGRRGEHSGGDRRVRLLRHDPVGLAVRPLRQPLAVVLLLRPARAVADLSALHRLLGRQPVAVRGVLRPRLGRDRAADRAAGGRRLRPERANVTFGWIFAAHQLGAATAAFGAGAARTELASYLPAVYVAGAACLIASALVMTLAQPRRRQTALA